MKKFLIMGVLALTAMSWLTSCSDKDIDPYSNIDARKQRFDQVFKQVFGDNIDPNQDWGFWNGQSETLARTRTVVKTDMTDYPTTGNPAPITDSEREYVNDWFASNPGLSTQGLDIHNFYIQHVIGNTGNKQGMWYYRDPVHPENDKDIEFFSNEGIMDYLLVGAVADGDQMEHVNDFNAQTGGPFSVVYIKDGSALQFGYHETFDNSYRYLFKLAKINVPGVGEGWYVGLSMYGVQNDNGEKRLGEQLLQYADDWILKIVPADGNDAGNTPQTIITTDKREEEFLNESGRVFCEDLGASSQDADNLRKDLDYNDVVFDVFNYYKKIYTRQITTTKIWNGTDSIIKNDTTWVQTGGPVKSRTYVVLQAAGGTIPLQVGGIEVHEKFNVGTATMVNTVKNSADVYGSYLTRDPVGFNTPTAYGSIDSIPIVVRYSDEVGEITAYEGQAPMKICVPVGTAWAAERHGIGDAYPAFKQYVMNHTVNPWFSSDPDHLYSGSTSTYVPDYAVTGDEVTLEHSTTVSEAQDVIVPERYFSVSDNGAVVNVYGEALSGAELKAYVGEEEIQGSYARTRAVVQTRSFTLSASQAEEAKKVGVTLKGKYFTIHKIGVQEFEPDVPERQGDVLWEGEKQITATSGVSISSGSLADAGKKTVIRVYGVGKVKDGNPWQVILSKSVDGAYSNISGTESKSSKSGAYELAWVMSKEGAADLRSHGLFVRGQNFKIKYVTIDNSQAEPDYLGTVVWPASGEGNTELTWGTSTVYLDADFLKAKGIGKGSVFRFYGSGPEGWQAKVTADWTAYDLPGWVNDTSSGKNCLQNYWSNNNKANVEVGFSLTLTEALARTFLTSGLRLSGEKFTLKYVTIDNTNATPVVIGGDDSAETVIWTPDEIYTEWGNSVYALNPDKIESSFAGKTMRIYCTFNSQYYFQFKFRFNQWEQFPEDALNADSNWSFEDNRKWIAAGSGAKNETKGCIELKLNASLVSAIKATKAIMYLDQVTISRITVE